MYLPFSTTFSIFVGGVIRWITDTLVDARKFNEAQRARIENAVVLIASGLIAGEALLGLVTAYFAWQEIKLPEFFPDPSLAAGMAVIGLLAFILVRGSIGAAGHPDEPAPPTAMM